MKKPKSRKRTVYRLTYQDGCEVLYKIFPNGSAQEVYIGESFSGEAYDIRIGYARYPALDVEALIADTEVINSDYFHTKRSLALAKLRAM